MKAMILAAGRGERMRPLTDTLPKPLLQVGGKPLIVWHLERLAAVGITDIVINHSHLGHLIEAALGDGKKFNVNISYSREAEALDIGGGVANALPLLGEAPFVLVSGDIYTDYRLAPLRAVADAMQADSRLAHLVLVETLPLPPYNFNLDRASDSVLDGASPHLTYAGIGVFGPSLFTHIERGTKAALLPLLLKGIAAHAISGEVYAGPYANLTTATDLDALSRRLHG